MEDNEKLRQQISALEKRAKRIEELLSHYEILVESTSPRLNAIMREGAPLEVFTRLAMIEHGYKVHGYYPFRYYKSTGSWEERSVDVYATKDSVFTVPADAEERAGDSWCERRHIIAEAKQRRRGVSWIFFQLPVSERSFVAAPRQVPVVNMGLEFKSGKDDHSKGAANPPAIKNAVTQLQGAYMPLSIDIENSGLKSHPNSSLHTGDTPHNSTWAILVTNAEIFLFTPPERFSDLEGNVPPVDEELFTKTPMLYYQPELSLHIKEHQVAHLLHAYNESERIRKQLPLDMADISPGILIVNFRHLIEVLEFIDHPPRIKRINLSIEPL